MRIVRDADMEIKGVEQLVKGTYNNNPAFSRVLTSIWNPDVGQQASTADLSRFEVVKTINDDAVPKAKAIIA